MVIWGVENDIISVDISHILLNFLSNTSTHKELASYMTAMGIEYCMSKEPSTNTTSATIVVSMVE